MCSSTWASGAGAVFDPGVVGLPAATVGAAPVGGLAPVTTCVGLVPATVADPAGGLAPAAVCVGLAPVTAAPAVGAVPAGAAVDFVTTGLVELAAAAGVVGFAPGFNPAGNIVVG